MSEISGALGLGVVGGKAIVREARPEEFALIGQIREQAYVGGGVIPAEHSYVPHLREVDGGSADDELWVAVDGEERVLGSVLVAWPPSPAAELSRPGELEFRMLATSPAARGRGIGELLVNAVFERARELRQTRVVLSVADDNATAMRLYRRLGFQRLPERDWRPVPDVRLLAFAAEL